MWLKTKAFDQTASVSRSFSNTCLCLFQSYRFLRRSLWLNVKIVWY